MKTSLLLITSLVLGGLACTQAQTTREPVFADGLLRISAVVQAWDGKQLQLKSAEGSTTMALPAEVIITKRLAGSLADVKPGVFLGSAAVRGADGQLHASEIHIIPDDLRGGTGGQRAMTEANTFMTNGSVGTLTDGTAVITQGSKEGMVMTLSYPEGKQPIQVASNVPVTVVTKVSQDMLHSGDQVNVTAKRNADDSITIQRIDIMSSPAK